MLINLNTDAEWPKRTFEEELNILGLSQSGAARFIGVSPRGLRRWIAFERNGGAAGTMTEDSEDRDERNGPAPLVVRRLLGLMIAIRLSPHEMSKMDGGPKGTRI